MLVLLIIRLQTQASINLAERLVFIDMLDSAETVLKIFYHSFDANPKDSTLLVKYHLTYGSLNRAKTQIKEAGDQYNSARKLAQQIGDTKNAALALLRLGAIYQLQSMDTIALEYYQQALAAYKQLNSKNGMSSNYANISSIYSHFNNFKLADQYLDSTLQIEQAQGNTEALIRNYGNAIINAVDGSKDFERAEHYMDKLAEVVPKTTSPRMKGFAQNVRATYFIGKHDYPAAHEAAIDAYRIGKEAEIKSVFANAFQNLVEASEGAKDFEAAYKYQKEWNAFKDSINQVEQENAIVELKTQYETEKKVAENLRLHEENAQQATLNRVLGTGGSTLVLLLGALGFLYYRQNKQKSIIERQAAELRKLNDVKSEFFANISNELRTPLTLVKGNIENALGGSVLPVDTEQKIKNARRSLGQLTAMIDDLLDLSKLELGRYELKKQLTPLNKLVPRVVSAFQSMSDEKNVTIKFEDLTSGDCHVKLDLRQFEKVVNNLIYNAFKFSKAGTSILIKLEVVDQFARLSVADQGIGIPEKDMPRIFDRFFQASNRADQPGSGLGLSIAKEITEMHGGSITVNSIAGVGSEFTVALPIQAPAIEELTHQSSLIEEVVGEKLRNFSTKKPLALLVEDNAQMQEYVHEILGKYFTVLTKPNGKEALEWLRGNTPALIISDVMMPEMDGFTLLENLKQSVNHSHIPVILLTARAGHDDRLRALRLGVDDYVTKPFDQDELLVKAVNMVNNLQQRLKWDKELGHDAEQEMALANGDDDKVIETLEAFVLRRISDQKIAVSELAEAVAMSERQLYRKLSSINGMSPGELTMEVRLQHARKLLLSGRIVKLSQLAMEVGIGTPAYLSKMFYERFGKRPMDIV
jgi:signal transduction histidine kinase/CheY-like chemotaxis protein/AraC-like DNA-binding protein